MVTRRRRRSNAPVSVPRVRMEYMDINGIAPYSYNPRDNAAAIESVANSIRTFGFLVPVVIDHDNILVAGHTRVEAAKTLGLNEVPAIRADHLTPDQIDTFRIIDNKVAELARWDFDLLSHEISRLRGSGIEFTEYGFAQEEIDCLTDVVADDCLNTENLVDQATRDRIRRTERRAPQTARIVIGEVVFFVPATTYREWVDAIRVRHDYEERAIIRDIKQRLGMNTED